MLLYFKKFAYGDLPLYNFISFDEVDIDLIGDYELTGFEMSTERNKFSIYFTLWKDINQKGLPTFIEMVFLDIKYKIEDIYSGEHNLLHHLTTLNEKKEFYIELVSVDNPNYIGFSIPSEGGFILGYGI